MADPTGLAAALIAAVEVGRVHALLLERAPSYLDEQEAEDHELYQEIVEGIATEVAPLLRGVTTGQRWDLATWAVELGVAARLEAALVPQETGLDQSGLSRSLERSYAAVKAQLVGDLDGDPGPVIGRPRGKFPPALCYPDPTW